MRHNPIRIDPAFDNPEKIRAMFKENAPYRATAAYAPSGIVDETREQTERRVPPWFRGNWAVGGKPLVEGAERILWNKKFLEAAKACFVSELVEPEFVVINVNAPMPAGPTHIDNPSFLGATRENYPLPLLRVMGHSGLFEAWRVMRASSITWFYEGPGGSFEYWPEGLDGPMVSEQSPFNNVALCADTDGCTTASAPSAIRHRSHPTFPPQRRFSRTATAIGQFSKMVKSARCIQTLPSAFLFSGKP